MYDQTTIIIMPYLFYWSASINSSIENTYWKSSVITSIDIYCYKIIWFACECYLEPLLLLSIDLQNLIVLLHDDYLYLCVCSSIFCKLIVYH